MACTPFPALTIGLFDNSAQGVWANFNEAKGNRSCSYSGGILTVTGPNGSTTFSPPSGGSVRHKFIGTGNFLAVMTTEAGPGPVTRTVSIVNFVATAITSLQVIFVNASSTNSLPFVQPSQGNGNACLVGAATDFGVAGIAILRSDTGATLCAGPGPYTPTNQLFGEALGTSEVRIKDGGAVISGPCALPQGRLDVQPDSQAFPTVKVGGCPQPPSTRQFTLRNSGTDCLTINSVSPAAPFTVTAQSSPFPVTLNPGASMTVTVTFAPATVGTFSASLAVNRSPAIGDSTIGCTGAAQQAQPAFTAPGLVAFGNVPVGATGGRSVAITNTGDMPINVSVAAGTSGPFTWPAFAGQLNCGQSTTIAVSFAPTAEGSTSATMIVVATPGGNRTVTLQGAGCIPNAVITLPATGFPAFGDVRQGYRMPRFMVVQNTGDGPLTFRASISGPDAALFGLMRASQSLTDVAPTRMFSIDPTVSCGPGPTGSGRDDVVIVFFANGAPPHAAMATLTIDNHDDPSAPASFSFALGATIIAGNVADAVAVFDTSGSMSETVPGGGTKIAAAVQAGRLLVSLLPPDLGNRIAGVRFSTDATTFLPMAEVTAGNQAADIAAVADPPLTANGWTAIAAGAMTALPAFAVPRAGATPPVLSKSVIVLTDGKDNTAFHNPADGQYYTIEGIQASDPANLSNLIATHPFVPPSDIKFYAIGLGTDQDIDRGQLSALASGAGGYYLVVDPTQPAVTYELQKLYTQIYMDLFDSSTIADPRNTIDVGQKQVMEFDILAGDVNAIVVMYDFDGIRLPFWLESPAGEIVDASFVPPGFQLRSGYTDSTRFLDFVLPWSEPQRYAGRWRLVVTNDGRACRGRPSAKGKTLGFLPGDCGQAKGPIEYGFAIGVGSNFRLQAYTSAAPAHVGDPIRLTANPTEAGLAVMGCLVTVDVTAPGGQQWTNLPLFDDGAHQDGDPNDGEYARMFTNTQVAGSYTFRFQATGQTRDGKPVHREAIRAKYVEGTVRPPVGPGGSGGIDECCERLIKLLEQREKAPSRNTRAATRARKG